MKFGKKPAVRTPRRMRAMLTLGAALDSLGPPPAATFNRDPVRKALGLGWYQMYGNDEYGDCVWVDSGNSVPFLQAIAGRPIVVPTLADVLGCYAAVTGFQPATAGRSAQNDSGTDENTAVDFLKSTGVAGHRIDDAAPIDHTNLDHVKWAIALFKLRSGISVNAQYIQAFERRQPWTSALPAGDEGHDVPWLDYDPNGVYAGTWARDDQFIPWDKVLQPGFVDELHAELWFDIIRDTGLAPDGLSLDQLDADLRAIGPEEARYTQNVTTHEDGGAIVAAKHGLTRSPHWPKVRLRQLAHQPVCPATGLTAVDGAALEAHHEFPFHYCVLLGRPSRELALSNLITLCRHPVDVHLLLGHDDNFEESDLDPTESAHLWHGKSEAEIRADPAWIERKKTAFPPWRDWTRDQKIAARKKLDADHPIGDVEYEEISKEFGVTDVPYDDWVKNIP